MYKNLAATPVAACLIAPVFCWPAVSLISRKGGAGPAAGTQIPGLLPDAQDGLTP